MTKLGRPGTVRTVGIKRALIGGAGSVVSAGLATWFIAARWNVSLGAGHFASFVAAVGLLHLAVFVGVAVWRDRAAPDGVRLSLPVMVDLTGLSTWLLVFLFAPSTLRYLGPIKFVPLYFALMGLFLVGLGAAADGLKVSLRRLLRPRRFASYAILAAAFMLSGPLQQHPSLEATRDAVRSWTGKGRAGHRLVTALGGRVFKRPLKVVADPRDGDVVYVLERDGRLLRMERSDPRTAPTTALDIRERVSVTFGGENGAWAVVFHPDSVRGDSSTGGLFVTYSTRREGEEYFRLSRFEFDFERGRADADSERVLHEQRKAFDVHHYGGGLAFGPDGFLYVSFGDGFEPDGLFGGVARLEVAAMAEGYRVPADNPFVGHPGVRDEMWSIGLRNPFSLSFDRASQRLWVADIGADDYEEVNVAARGSNHGWPFQEGPKARPQGDDTPAVSHRGLGVPTKPVHAYPHENMRICVVGGVVYRGRRHADLDGAYLFADFFSGEVFALDVDDPKERRTLIDAATGAGRHIVDVTQLGEEVFVVDMGSMVHADGRILRLERSTASGPAVPQERGAQDNYDRLCASCHGRDGRLERAWPTSTPPRDLRDPAWHRSRSDEQVGLAIRQGGAAVGVSSQMPRWSDLLSDAEVDALVELIRSWEQFE